MRAFPLLLWLASCEAWDHIQSPFDDADDERGCEELDGTFLSGSLAFTSLDDPDLVEGFDDFRLDLDVEEGTFASTLDLDGEVFEQAGSFVAFEDQLLFSAPFVAGVGGNAALDCAFDGDELRLAGPTTFDFAEDDVDGFVNADFAGALATFP